MELKEYWNIIKKDRKAFFLVVTLMVFASMAYFAFRPVSYDVSLALSITRSGIQETNDYRYDDFYRLQADEKFAETVVEWLKNPRIVMDIYTKAGMNMDRFSLGQLSKMLKSEKLSSQIVSVSFSSSDDISAKKISDAIAVIVEKNVEVLNENQNEETWFRVIAQSPVIVKNQGTIWLIFVFPMLAGIFVGLWVVMIRHYLK
jgi:capsular polysaccharide biosynthesis protein